jgi:ankyrin repeat protein
MPRKKAQKQDKPDRKVQDDKDAALFASVRYGMIAEAEKALKDGANINARGPENATPLHIAVAMHFEETARMLVEEGADVDLKDSRDITPLNIAAFNGDLGIVQLLLKAGAKADEPDANGTTPLFMAVGSGNMELAKIFLEAGADTKRVILDGLALLHVSAMQGNLELTKMLFEAGAQVNALTAKQMDDYPAKSTPLDIAELKGHRAVADFLKEKGGKRAKDIKKKRSK